MAATFLSILLAAAALAHAGLDDRHKQDLKRDVEMGENFSKEIEKVLTLSEDEAVIARVQRIGSLIADVANRKPAGAQWGDTRHNTFEYLFKVVDDKDVNAFSLPGGFIYVNTGLVAFAESDDELAAVLAHEVAHAAHRHVATLIREQNKIDVWSLPVMIGAILSGSREASTLLLTKELINTAILSGWTQRAEMDADQAGFKYILDTGYHPVALLTFMERLAFKERMGPNIDWGIHRTHPPSRERARALEAMLRAEGLQIARSKVTRTYRTTAEPADDEEVVVRFGAAELFRLRGPDAAERGEDAVERLNEFFDASPQMFAVRVVGNRLLWTTRGLFEFTQADAPEGLTAAHAAEQAAANIKRALFSLGFRTGG